MSDDQWRRARGEPDPEFDDDEFGAVRFADDGDETQGLEFDAGGGGLSFGSGDTGSLPHWTSPPTGEVPAAGREQDDLDVWSTFSGSNQHDHDDDSAPVGLTGQNPTRIQIGTDPTGEGERPAQPRGRDDESRGKERPARPAARPRAAAPRGPRPAGSGRDMPAAIGMGLALGAVFLVIDAFGPTWLTMVFACLVVGLGAVEFFDKTTEHGYQPATVIGIAAVLLAPAAAYFNGVEGALLAVTFGFVASAIAFVGSPGLQSGPLPNTAITNLGIVYLGLLGSFAGLILGASNVYLNGTKNVGTDTLMLVAIGVVAADIGALFVGSAAGRTPLRGWISPNKTVEGFIGGLVASVLAVSLAGMVSDSWNGKVNLLVLGVGIGVLAPLGDLVESMFKRNLDIKDFGTLIKGHGGVLDRFDGFLFALPFAYYTMITLQPWTYVK